jgi:hypothetical protein
VDRWPRFLLWGGLACLFAQPSWAAAEDLEPLRRSIAARAEKVSRALGLQAAPLNVTGRAIQFHADGTVEVGAIAVNELLKTAAPESSETIVAFLVAHEMWHRWQVQTYKVNFFRLEPEDRRLLECQADLLSLRLLFEESQALEDRGEHTTAVIRSMALLSTHGGKWHLSGVERERIWQVGLARVLADDRAATGETLEFAKAVGAFVDARTGEAMPNWAIRSCRKILRHDAGALAAVVAEESEIDVTGASGREIVSYRVMYRNRSARPVRLEGTLGVPPFSVEPAVLRRGPATYRHFALDIPGAAESTLRGTLTWPHATRGVIRASLDPAAAESPTLFMSASYRAAPSCSRPEGPESSLVVTRGVGAACGLGGRARAARSRACRGQREVDAGDQRHGDRDCHGPQEQVGGRGRCRHGAVRGPAVQMVQGCRRGAAERYRHANRHDPVQPPHGPELEEGRERLRPSHRPHVL